MAILITNLLSPNRNFRMTANGILEFIAGRCVPSEIKNAQNMQQFPIFNRVLFGEFLQILEELQNELVQNSADDEQIEKRKEVNRQKREKLAKMANIVTKRQDKVHKELVKCRNVCETGI
ncbi:hypothetical protein niasHT_022026 [Heterodera trifolii]|uniref:Uncharacterized protein n=1 Tax=Heterodera trifolii TaxID=157864 RepID=A0ABD2JBN2_9BILA